MDGPFFAITIVAMVAAAAGAAIGAALMSLKHFSRRPVGGVSAALLGAGLRAQSLPQRLLALPPPRPKEPPRLDVFLISADAPPRIVMPLNAAVGRLLEVGLPLVMRWTGEQDLRDVLIRIVLPNAITYGASLDRMVREGPPAGLIGPKVAHTNAAIGTMIVVRADRLAHGEPVILPFPMSVRHGTAGSFRIEIDFVCDSRPTVSRAYTLEISDGSTVVRPPKGWTCVPDQAERIRDPRQPIDRLASTHFTILRA